MKDDRWYSQVDTRQLQWLSVNYFISVCFSEKAWCGFRRLAAGVVWITVFGGQSVINGWTNRNLLTRLYLSFNTILSHRFLGQSPVIHDLVKHFPLRAWYYTRMELPKTESQRAHKHYLVIHCGNFHCGAGVYGCLLRDLVIKTLVQHNRSPKASSWSNSRQRSETRDLNTHTIS